MPYFSPTHYLFAPFPSLAAAAALALAGTSNEFQDKVIQLGYVAFFSSCFPIAPLLFAVYNSIELRTDANKICDSYRRPRYTGAQDIGTWRVCIALLAWLAIPVNVFVACFADDRVRDHVFIPMSATEECYDAPSEEEPAVYAQWFGRNTSWKVFATHLAKCKCHVACSADQAHGLITQVASNHRSVEILSVCRGAHYLQFVEVQTTISL